MELGRAATKLVRIAVMENDTIFWVSRELEKLIDAQGPYAVQRGGLHG
jgi:hypothetical protein